MDDENTKDSFADKLSVEGSFLFYESIGSNCVEWTLYFYKYAPER